MSESFDLCEKQAREAGELKRYHFWGNMLWKKKREMENVLGEETVSVELDTVRHLKTEDEWCQQVRQGAEYHVVLGRLNVAEVP